MLPAGWRWMSYVDYAAWSTRLLALDQFDCVGGLAAGCPGIAVTTPAGPVVMDRAAFVESQLLDYPAGAKHWAWLWMAVNVAGFVAALYGVVRLINWQKR